MPTASGRGAGDHAGHDQSSVTLTRPADSVNDARARCVPGGPEYRSMPARSRVAFGPRSAPPQADDGGECGGHQASGSRITVIRTHEMPLWPCGPAATGKISRPAGEPSSTSMRTAGAYALNVPHPGRDVMRPAVRSLASARTTVALATPCSAAISRMLGSASPLAMPASCSRSAASTRSLGVTGPRTQ
jgi:hypothetical protein